ncbi:hypothetical protein D1AOALGA4SA_8727 [Olavius algarvensis Delta 1 endosymbiont]|nr:hypothetical protein D1AOALGA4SA_8727 [Olavius algarvensis Delta 1 endosymbiont]
MTNDGIASLSRFKWTECIIRCSLFAFSKFLFFDLTGRSRPEAALM